MRPTDEQIRAHLADLNLILDIAPSVGDFGELMMHSHARLLTWVLQGDPVIDRIVTDTRRDADGLREARKARQT